MTRLTALITAAPPALVAVFIAKLWFTGTLDYYINSQTAWVVLLGGLLFALVGAVALWRAWHSHGHGSRLTWRTFVFLIPVLVGIFVPAQPLSANSSQSSSLGGLQLTSHVSSGGGGDMFGYWLGAIASHPSSAWWNGRKVTLVGFATSEPGLPGHSIIVGRYLITCCVLDATMLGFPAQIKGAMPKQGTWVQISGRFGKDYWTDQSGQQYPLIKNATVAPVSIPSSPYLSP